MDRKHCLGCYNDFYNHNNMGMNMATGKPECWMLKDAKIIWRKEVHIDQRPPWTQKAERFPDCYHCQSFIYVSPNRVR